MDAQPGLDPFLVVGGGFGSDDSDDKNLAAGTRLKNVVTEAHLVLRSAGPLVLGFEYRRMQTTCSTGTLVNDHLNVGVGFVF